jgi:membrane protease YdiL (CAAX protease family)
MYFPARKIMNCYPTYKQAIGLMGIWLFWSILSFIPFYFIGDIFNGINLSLFYTISMTLTCATGFRLRKSWSMPVSSFPWQVIALAIILILSSEVVLEPLIKMADSNALMRLYNGIQRQPIPFFFMVVIAAPILEEILFRGIILDGFLKNYKPTPSILVSAILFAVIHANVAQSIGALVIGAVFGWIYFKTQSIIPSIILHALVNGISYISVLNIDYSDLNKSTRDWFGSDIFYFSFYFLCVVLAGLCAWYLHERYFREHGDQKEGVEKIRA